MWLRFSEQLEHAEVHHHDIVHFALTEVMNELAEGRESEVLTRLKQHIEGNKKTQDQSDLRS